MYTGPPKQRESQPFNNRSLAKYKCQAPSEAGPRPSTDRIGTMKQLAEGLYQLDGRPRNAINVYLAGDVLIDAGTRQAESRILRQLQGTP